jgi:molybdopterin molybdotransferase
VAGEHDISVERAIELAIAAVFVGDAESVPVAESGGRLLAADVRATRDLPAANSSAMDGWAVRAAETPGELRVVSESAAGRATDIPVGAGEAIAISTGAVLPMGADAVARREIVDVDGATVRVQEAVAPGRDVRQAGEVIRASEVLLPDGHRVMPHEVGAIGAVGQAAVLCAARPTIAILSTGAELIPLGAPARDADVYDSSRFGLAAQAHAAGVEVAKTSSIGDDLTATIEALAAMLAGPARVVVTNGGMGGGAHDHVRKAFEALGVETIFLGVRAKPIRPTFLGRQGERLVLGLPGNPVSAAVAFHLFARPLLGLDHTWWRAPILADVPSRPGRAELVLCTETPEGLIPTPHQAAHAVTSLVGASAIVWIAEDADSTVHGTPVSFVRFG